MRGPRQQKQEHMFRSSDKLDTLDRPVGGTEGHWGKLTPVKGFRASGHHNGFCLWVPGISGCRGLVLVDPSSLRGGLHSLRLSTSFEKFVAVPGLPLFAQRGITLEVEHEFEKRRGRTRWDAT
eukprot:g76874.t1